MYRSKLKHIQLVALCKHKYIKKYSIQAVLEPFIEDLKLLVSALNGILNADNFTMAAITYIAWI